MTELDWKWHATKYTASASVTHLSSCRGNVWTDAAVSEVVPLYWMGSATASRLQIENVFDRIQSQQIISLLCSSSSAWNTQHANKEWEMLNRESVFRLMLSYGTEAGWINMRTENVVPCHPGHNAVSSISGCPSCDHAALSFQSHVTLSTLLCYSPPTGKATPMHLVASDTFPSSATKQRNENKSECSLRSRREITDVLVPDCNMAAWSLLARRGRKIKKRFPPAFGGINLLVVGLFPCRDAAP